MELRRVDYNFLMLALVQLHPTQIITVLGLMRSLLTSEGNKRALIEAGFQ